MALHHRIENPGKRLSRFAVGVLGAAFVFIGAGRLPANDLPLMFTPGERLVFEIKWTVIPAGRAVLEVFPVEEINGVPAYHFVMTARTSNFVDHFYKVRDRIDAYADLSMSRSLLFKKKQREGKSKRNILVTFDWEKKQAQYANYNKQKKPITIQEGTLDPLSAFYFTRRFDWENNTEMARPVTDGKKNIIGRAYRVRRETIEVPAGTFDTILFEPDIEHIGGVFEKSKNAKIELWVTDDKRHIPVKLRSEVVVGSFTGELVTIEGGSTK